MQEAAWSYSLVLMTLIVAGFIYVAMHSRQRKTDYGPLVKRAYTWRARFFWLLVLVFFPVMIYNLFDLPYGPRAAQQGPATHTISAIGHMWYWELDKNEVKRGEPVDIHVTSADVNHGFGIYDPSMRLIAQTQAMPGYTNTIRHAFEEAGVYRVLCLEYCGLVHHNMMAEIQVNP